MQEVESRTAFVTGGASGIGLGMARAFVAAGMNVVIADLRRDHIDAAVADFAGGSVHAIELDVTDRERFARAADEATSSSRISGVGTLMARAGRHGPLLLHEHLELVRLF